MSQVLTIKLSDNDANELKAVISACTAEIKRAHESMERDQLEIDQLKTETRVIAVETRTILEDLQRAA